VEKIVSSQFTGHENEDEEEVEEKKVVANEASAIEPESF
jgi:hypothetical protein